MQMCSMEVPERRGGGLCIRIVVHLGQLVPLPADEIALGRFRRILLQRIFQSPREQYTGGVRQDLDARANLPNLRCGLENGDIVAG